jgi:hypothetical protein
MLPSRAPTNSIDAFFVKEICCPFMKKIYGGHMGISLELHFQTHAWENMADIWENMANLFMTSDI